MEKSAQHGAPLPLMKTLELNRLKFSHVWLAIAAIALTQGKYALATGSNERLKKTIGL